MNIDWNWFFSSFSQSAAALIGIIGAFIISRLLGLSEKISSTISQFENLIINYSEIKESIRKRNFIWYTKTSVSYDSDLKKAIRNGEYENVSREEVLRRIYDADGRLYKNDEAVMEAFEEIYEEERPKDDEGMFNQSRIVLPKIDVIPTGLWNSLDAERDAINQLEIESKTLTQRFTHNQQELNSFNDSITPLRTIIIMLMIAFPLTVIYPLHFMPLPVNADPYITFDIIEIIKAIVTLKSTLLFVFLITIEGIFYYFLVLVNQLNNRLITIGDKNSDELRDIKSYSEYFGL